MKRILLAVWLLMIGGLAGWQLAAMNQTKAAAQTQQPKQEGYIHERDEQVAWFEANGKLLEAQRLRQRTEFDLEMIRELGYCSGIENYSRFFDRREPGTRPFCLLDYFPDDYLMIVDESHVTIPQVGGMSTTAINALATTVIANLSTSQIAGMSTTQVTDLSPNAFGALSAVHADPSLYS